MNLRAVPLLLVLPAAGCQPTCGAYVIPEYGDAYESCGADFGSGALDISTLSAWQILFLPEVDDFSVWLEMSELWLVVQWPNDPMMEGPIEGLAGDAFLGLGDDTHRSPVWFTGGTVEVLGPGEPALGGDPTWRLRWDLSWGDGTYTAAGEDDVRFSPP